MIKGCERTEVKESDNLLAGDKEPHGIVLDYRITRIQQLCRSSCILLLFFFNAQMLDIFVNSLISFLDRITLIPVF